METEQPPVPQPPAWQAMPTWGQPFPWEAAVDPRAAGRRRRRNVSLAVVVALVVAGVGGSAVVAHQRGDARATAVERRLPALEAFVEQQRGLRFVRPVDVEVLDPGAFLDAYDAGSVEVDPEQQTDAGAYDRDATLHGLTQLGDDEDLGAQQDEVAGDIVGFYDPHDGRLRVRGDRYDAYTELVLVHELTHALQDQHFHIATRYDAVAGNDDASAAWAAVVEGDATLVERAWYAAQPASVRAVIDAQDSLVMPAPDGDVVEDAFDFPYYAGPVVVQALLDGGGQAALDAALVMPPGTTAQALHPGRTRPRYVFEAPDLPVSGVVDRGTLGEVGFAELLGRDPLVPGPQNGWDGDSYLTVDEPAGPCTYDDVLVTSADARDELLTALVAWGRDRPGVKVRPTADDAIRLISCAT